MRPTLVAVFSVLFACTGESIYHPDDKGDDTPPGEADADTDAAPIIRFVALGDVGEANEDQYAVADAMASVCADKTTVDRAGCDFALLLGDNFYDAGVDGVDDSQFQTKFEDPYSVVDFPFYVVLGNHDYGELGLYAWQSDYEIEYSDHSDKWTMPSEYYTFEVEHAQFYGLDTHALMVESLWGTSDQRTWLPTEQAASVATWQIAFGHHPYISNGPHGNAGAYEGYEWLPIANGETIKDFMDDYLCGQVDLYLCGHDHSRQWLEPTCGTEFIVSGAGAKTSDFEDRGNAVRFEDYDDEGFMWIELNGNTLTGEFWNKNGTLDYSHSYTK